MWEEEIEENIVRYIIEIVHHKDYLLHPQCKSQILIIFTISKKKIYVYNKMKIGKIISVLLSLIIPSILYVHYYPWLYNKINNLTERGQDLDDQMDFVNVMLMFLVTWILIALFVFLIMTPLILKKK